MNIQYQTNPQTNTSYGSLSIYAFGGTPPFVYVLDGDTLEANIDSLTAGTYTLVVYDSFDCMQEETIIIIDESTLGFNETSHETSIYLSGEAIYFCTEPLSEQITEVYSLNGTRIVLINEDKGTGNCTKYDFQHPAGVYIATSRSTDRITRKMLYNP